MKQAKCPHCSNWLSERQVDRHLRDAEGNFEVPLSNDEMSDSGNADAEMSDDTDVEMSDGSDAGALNTPGAVDVPGGIENPGAVDNLGAGCNPDSGSDLGLGGGHSDDEGTYSLRTRAAC
jgi:hypothetical protein